MHAHNRAASMGQNISRDRMLQIFNDILIIKKWKEQALQSVRAGC